MRKAFLTILSVVLSVNPAFANNEARLLALAAEMEAVKLEVAELRQQVVGSSLRIRSMRGMRVIGADDGTCPEGFTVDNTFQGRFPLGLPSGGTVGGTQGQALSNRELRRGGTGHGGASDNLSISYSNPRISYTPPRVSYTRPSGSVSGSASYQRPTVSVTWPSASVSGSVNYRRPTATFRGTTASLSHYHTYRIISFTTGNEVRSGAGLRIRTQTAQTSGPATGLTTGLSVTPSGSVTLSGGGASLSNARVTLSGGSASLSGGSVSLSGLSVALSGGSVTLSGGSGSVSGGSASLRGGAFGGGASNQLPPAPYVQVVFCEYTL